MLRLPPMGYAQHEGIGDTARPERSVAKSKGQLMDRTHQETVLCLLFECGLPRKMRLIPQLPLNAQKLVELGYPVSAAP